MITSTVKYNLNYNVETIWDIITSFSNVSWRSDLKSAYFTDKNNFIEISNTDIYTYFKIIELIPYSYIKLEFFNENISGHWIGSFSNSTNSTNLKFTENVVLKKTLPSFILKLYLKKQQRKYLKDLENILEFPKK